MTAAEFIAAGYRLYWVEVRKDIPVLCKPSEAHVLNYGEVQTWAEEEDDEEWEHSARLMRDPSKNDHGVLPFVTCEIDDDPPTIGELLEAQKAVEKP